MKMPSPKSVLLVSILMILLNNYVHLTEARKHNLHLFEDSRRLIHITSFGFFKGGFMKVEVNEIYVEPEINNVKGKPKQTIGFTVDRTLKDGINPYPHEVESTCALPDKLPDDTTSTILFSIDFADKTVSVGCSPSLVRNVHIYRDTSDIPYDIYQIPRGMGSFRNIMTQPQRRRRNAIGGPLEVSKAGEMDQAGAETLDGINKPVGVKQIEAVGEAVEIPKRQDGQVDVSPKSAASNVADTADKDELGLMESPKLFNGNNQGQNVRPASEDGSNNNAQPDLNEDSNLLAEDMTFVDPATSCITPIPLNSTKTASGIMSYSFSFVVYIGDQSVEGLYNLYFHNCADDYGSRVTLNVSIVEENSNKNYLSAGEMPLPALYFMMSVLFFVVGCFWVFILRKSKRETGVAVFKIHYLMGTLVFIKSLSLLFHSINYHFIQIEGGRKEGWAVLYYITHLLKGALLFITILLIGTGYAFVKHLLSDKDKKIFMIVIPLQVLANVAQIIIDESEEGEVVHSTWQVIFISVDLLCCCAILFPVVWSIRHLQEASQTDGKAATNLRKLKMFRHFYIIVVCYIYFTRIIVQMLLRITVPFQYEWLDDMFREMTTFIFFVLTGYKFRPAANNPYLELAHDSEDEEMDTVITESGLTEGAVKRGYKPRKKTLKEIVLFDPNEEETDDDEEVLLEKRREASHDLD